MCSRWPAQRPRPADLTTMIPPPRRYLQQVMKVYALAKKEAWATGGFFGSVSRRDVSSDTFVCVSARLHTPP
jgi:hypothetical protein